MTELTDKEKMTRIRTALPPDEELYDLAADMKKTEGLRCLLKTDGSLR